MSTELPNLEIPPMECPAVLLPQPANLSNFFGGLASFPAKLIALAKTTASAEAEKFLKQAEEIQKLLDDIRSIFSPYDPKFKKLSIPEKEWEIIIQRLIEEYPGYIQAKIMEIISSFVSFNMPLLGISIDVLKLITDRAYLDELAKDIAGFGADVEAQIAAFKLANPDISAEELQKKIDELRNAKLDSLFDMLPDEYKLFSGEYGLENAELKAKQIMDYIKNEAQKFMNGQLFSGFGGLIGAFQEIWDTLGLPALPVPLTGPDVGAMIKAIVEEKKAEFKSKLEALGDNPLQEERDKLVREMNKGIVAGLEELEILGFKVKALLGGDFLDNTESIEFTVARITAKLKEFRENWQLFLIREWMGKVTKFFSKIGLSSLTQFATLDFCTFLGLMGIPKTIDLSSFGNITTKANEFTSELNNKTITVTPYDPETDGD